MIRIKSNIEIIKNICKDINYTCLTENITNCKEYIEFICDKGHHCKITYSNFYYHDRRCGFCNIHRKKTIEYVRECCEEKGLILDDVYTECFTKMKCVCKKEGHIFYKNLIEIRECNGCIVCFPKFLIPTIEQVKDYCLSIGFTCLSEEYITAKDKLKLLCHANNHIFYACFDKIKHHRGCPYCKQSRSEKMVRYCIEQLTNKKFEKIRHKKIRNPVTGRPLEIDMYNKELNIGFEYQGNQHYQKINKFKSTDEMLKTQQERDELKRIKCKELGIKLIEIAPLPYNKNKFDPQLIKNIVVNVLIENNIEFINKELSDIEIIKASNI